VLRGSTVGKNQRDFWRAAMLLSTIGMVLVASTFAGFLIGYALDRWLGTMPWLSIVGLALGIAAGFLELIRIVRRLAKNF
jgi:ATP synthase protein I